MTPAPEPFPTHRSCPGGFAAPAEPPWAGQSSSERCRPSDAPFRASKWGTRTATLERSGGESSVFRQQRQHRGQKKWKLLLVTIFKTWREKKQPDTLFCPRLWLRISCMVGLRASVPAPLLRPGLVLQEKQVQNALRKQTRLPVRGATAGPQPKKELLLS